MAEARLSIRPNATIHHVGFEVDTSTKKVQLSLSHNGLVLFIPHHKYLFKSVRRSFWRSVDKAQLTLYPVPLSAVAALTACVFVSVLKSPPDSVWRSGKIATFIWNIDDLNPFTKRFPADYRIAAICANGAAGVVLVLSAIHRFFIRQMLSYKGWIYEQRKPSTATKIWGALMQMFFSRRLQKTEAYQSCLPSQPLPPLEETVERFLASMAPLFMEKKEEWAMLKQLAKGFVQNEGPKLQWYLRLKHALSENYMTDWWLKYVYLSSRESLLISSNWYGFMFAQYSPTNIPEARAASLVYSLIKIKKQIDRRIYSPDFSSTIPLCMDQFLKIFGTTRIPGREMDVLEQHENISYIVVMFKGRFYQMQVLNPINNHQITPYQLEAAFASILHSEDETDPLEELLPGLTSAPRSEWADLRDRHFISNTYNIKPLRIIEKAIFVLCFDDIVPENLSVEGKNYLCGNGHNRWADKSFNAIVTANGKVGINVEHSWGDALTFARIMEYCSTVEEYKLYYNNEGHCKPLPEDTENIAKNTLHIYSPNRIRFTIDKDLKKVILSTHEKYLKRIDNLDLHVQRFAEYGKNLPKKLQCSPDAWAQMALQLAYFRNQGHFDQTYESASLRMYLKGRTETIRTVSDQSCAFVRAMDDPSFTKEQRLQLLNAACVKHQRTTHDSVAGRGVDRHLFALYVVGLGKEIPSEFLRQALSPKWKLSTSQVLTRQLPASMHPADSRPFETPIGGFGPVADDGYGVSYCLFDEGLFYFTITSSHDCPKTSSAEFGRQIEKALRDMAELSDVDLSSLPRPAPKSLTLSS